MLAWGRENFVGTAPCWNDRDSNQQQGDSVIFYMNNGGPNAILAVFGPKVSLYVLPVRLFPERQTEMRDFQKSSDG